MYANSMSRLIHLAFQFMLLLSLTHSAIADAPMIVPGSTRQITKNVYVIPDNRVSLVPNIGIIVGDESIMVVDTGMGPKNAKIVLEEVKKISDKPIKYLAITHFHPEHGMGAQSFPKETQIIVPIAQKQELEKKGPGYIEFFSGMSPEIADLLSDVKLVSPDIAFDKKMEVDLGGQKVELYHFQTAHTQGDMFVYLPDQQLLFGGDIIIERFFPIMPDADSSALGWMESLKQLKALDPLIIVPGHGDVSDASLIDQLSIYLAALKIQVERHKKNGDDAEQASAQLVPQFQRSYSHWDEAMWIKFAIERFYSEL
jgi:glyoxylase-like metal-dependent hydrolase (beta-lactamase superfamily II)